VLDEVAEVTALGAHHEDELVGRVEAADAIIVYHDHRSLSYYNRAFGGKV
jgi:hypothetical protein